MEVPTGMEYEIRPAGLQDCVHIMRMIRELAEYEKLADKVQITEEVLKKDGFGDNPFYKCFVVELCSGQKSKEGFTVVGYALYCIVYSTWEGPFVHLEDLYVMPEFRASPCKLQLGVSPVASKESLAYRPSMDICQNAAGALSALLRVHRHQYILNETRTFASFWQELGWERN
ncbi:thialysine N-epsilon-acetyltransferase-like isoform X2 [Pleurodeles waltl]|uniref:thialysine N-epsilon-acetyltransferase-like isoform X2 n=1 Tax=Pleurodeles waltl TaxID=8319 RepID=UPI003709A9AF